MRRTARYYRMILRHDLPAGISVFLVALPLCLGIALASGAPLYAGILSGVVGGLVVSLVSGSQLAVSGPAAGLTTLVSASIISLGEYRTFLLVVMVAGLFQIVLGALRLGVIANYFPSSVVKGLLAAIGLLLISNQVPVAFGYDRADFWTRGVPALFYLEGFFGEAENLRSHFYAGPVIIALTALGILVLLQQPFAKRWRIIPAPLVAVISGILLAWLFSSRLALSETQVVNIPEGIFSGMMWPDFSKFFSDAEIWKRGVTVGLIASVETLLCIEAMDKLDPLNRITPINRELVAQGVGNITCGLVGGIPLTAVVVRGAANVDAGARTRLSAFTHGLLLLLSVITIPFLLNRIPYAALAAVLIVTGYNLTKPKLYRDMWRLGRKQFIPFAVTVVMILATDLLIGVGIGLLFSVYFIVRNNFKAEYRLTRKHELGVDYCLITLNTNVTFLNKVKLKKTLDEVPEYAVLTIDGSHCNFIDHDILEVISEYQSKARERHIELKLMGIKTVKVSSVH